MKKFLELRERAYNLFWAYLECGNLGELERDFAVIYLTEGSKTNRNYVAVANCNPNIIKVTNLFIHKYGNLDRMVEYEVQYHLDKNPEDIIKYWKNIVGLDKKIKLRLKEGGLKTKKRLEYGTMTIRISDTYLRCKVQALMDFVENQWISWE